MARLELPLGIVLAGGEGEEEEVVPVVTKEQIVVEEQKAAEQKADETGFTVVKASKSKTKALRVKRSV